MFSKLGLTVRPRKQLIYFSILLGVLIIILGMVLTGIDSFITWLTIYFAR